MRNYNGKTNLNLHFYNWHPFCLFLGCWFFLVNGARGCVPFFLTIILNK